MLGVRSWGRPLDGEHYSITPRGQDDEQALLCVGDRVSLYKVRDDLFNEGVAPFKKR